MLRIRCPFDKEPSPLELANTARQWDHERHLFKGRQSADDRIDPELRVETVKRLIVKDA